MTEWGTEAAWTKEEWVQALRSGKYVQCVGTLHEDGKHCAMGVLLHLAGDRPIRISTKLLNTVIDMNDKQGKSFAEIADWLENL